jgi:predicted dehydrogenase
MPWAARREDQVSRPKLRWGLVTPGRIAHRFAQALEAVDGARLHAVASRSLERARAFAETYGAPVAVDSVEKLARDPDVDAVYVASPHRFHHEQTRLCLEAGKPVLCEKPFTVNAAQAADLIQVAESRGLFLMEALWSRYLPVWSQVRAWLDAGVLGELHLITSAFCFRPERDPADRKFNHELAGGALLDLGVYNVSLSDWVTRQSPSAVSAMAEIGDTRVDELTAATLVYPGRLVSQFVCSFMVDAVNEMVIYGTLGHIRIHANFWQSTRSTLVVGEDQIVAELPFRRNGFEYQIEEAMRCIREGRRESASMPHASTLSIMQTMDRIREQVGLRYSFE